MNDFFTSEQGNMLIRLLLAHILADFVFQSNWMVKNKRWVSWPMLLHVIVVYLASSLLTGLWLPSLVVAILHWMIDSLKINLQKRHTAKGGLLFGLDQGAHLLVLVGLWCWYYQFIGNVWEAIRFPFTDYSASLILLGYAIVIWPLAYFMKYALQWISPGTKATNVEKGGMLIGQFERIIILSFVLLGKYEAIGFLIAGKGIIRFADSDRDKLASEYVLVGTMMSYALSILIGLLINWLL